MEQDEIIAGFIKAITSYGSDDYKEFEEFYTEKNKVLFNEWLKQQPKVDGITLYRGYVFDTDYFGLEYVNEGDIFGVDNLTQLDIPSLSKSLLMYCFDFGEITITSKIRVVFEIVTHGKYCVDISGYSFYKKEKEYKCTEDARFVVNKIESKGVITKFYLEEV